MISRPKQGAEEWLQGMVKFQAENINNDVSILNYPKLVTWMCEKAAPTQTQDCLN